MAWNINKAPQIFNDRFIWYLFLAFGKCWQLGSKQSYSDFRGMYTMGGEL